MADVDGQTKIFNHQRHEVARRMLADFSSGDPRHLFSVAMPGGDARRSTG